MDPFQPMLANALTFAFEKATVEGKITISALILVSMISWSVIITKGRQILKARAATKRFLAAFRAAGLEPGRQPGHQRKPPRPLGRPRGRRPDGRRVG